jgi:hypothetical protein
MTRDEAERYVEERVRVARPRIVAAKRYLLSLGNGRIDVLAQSAVWAELAAPGALTRPSLQSDDAPKQLELVSNCISERLAIGAAAWELVRAGLMFQCGTQATHVIGWEFTDGGYSGGFSFKERFMMPYPEGIIRPSWHDLASDLFDGDLYLQHFESGHLNRNVAEAVRLSLACFRNELYVPCVAMLGAASEGAWFEAGTALAKRFPSESLAGKLLHTMQDVRASTREKIERVTHLYDQPYCRPIHQESGVDNRRLTEIQRWSDQIRESRNVLHWGSRPSVPNSYEKVAILLMDAVAELNDLNRVRATCSIVKPQTGNL